MRGKSMPRQFRIEPKRLTRTGRVRLLPNQNKVWLSRSFALPFTEDLAQQELRPPVHENLAQQELRPPAHEKSAQQELRPPAQAGWYNVQPIPAWNGLR